MKLNILIIFLNALLPLQAASWTKITRFLLKNITRRLQIDDIVCKCASQPGVYITLPEHTRLIDKYQ